MNESAEKQANILKKALTKKGFSIWLCSSWDGESARKKTDGTELILSIGEGWIDERSLLEAEVLRAEGSPQHTYYALNDVVIARGAVARVIYITARINRELLTTYKADGVILATATGSTGYALAAGGPVLPPHSKDFLLLPIVPLLSAKYCVVLPSGSKVQLGVQAIHPATLSIDGHTNLPLNSGAVISVRRSRHKIRFLRIHPESSFYGTLEKRLKGKQ